MVKAKWLLLIFLAVFLVSTGLSFAEETEQQKLRRGLDFLNQELVKAQKHLDFLHTNQAPQGEIKEAEMRVEETRKQINWHEKEIQRLVELEDMALQGDQAALEQKAQEERKIRANEIKGMLSGLDKELAEAKDKLAIISGKKKTPKAEVVETEERISYLQRRISSLEAELKELEQKPSR
ncbi:MAG: hypothetical protein V1727_01180 [Candidatus Omnitrophota bacterium]